MTTRTVMVEVIGETAGGKPNVWGIIVDGAPLFSTVRGRRIRRTFDTKRDAERHAEKLRKETP